MKRREWNVAVGPASAKTKNQFHIFQAAAQAGVDGVEEIGKVERRLGPLDPTTSGTEEFVERDVSHQEFDGR